MPNAAYSDGPGDTPRVMPVQGYTPATAATASAGPPRVMPAQGYTPATATNSPTQSSDTLPKKPSVWGGDNTASASLYGTPWNGSKAGSDGGGSWIGMHQRPMYPRNQKIEPQMNPAWKQMSQGFGDFRDGLKQRAAMRQGQDYMEQSAVDNPALADYFANLQAAEQARMYPTDPGVGGQIAPPNYGPPPTGSYNSAGSK